MRIQRFAMVVARTFWTLALCWAVAVVLWLMIGADSSQPPNAEPGNALINACFVMLCVGAVMGLFAWWARRMVFFVKGFVSLEQMPGALFYFGLTGFAACMALVCLAAGYLAVQAGGSVIWIQVGAFLCFALLAMTFPRRAEGRRTPEAP